MGRPVPHSPTKQGPHGPALDFSHRPIRSSTQQDGVKYNPRIPRNGCVIADIGFFNSYALTIL